LLLLIDFIFFLRSTLTKKKKKKLQLISYALCPGPAYEVCDRGSGSSGGWVE
jgi:hypothetical protein